LLKFTLKKKYNKPGNVFIGVTHRLDRPVSGLVLFAKTSKALSRLNEMFKTKNAKKTYRAVVANKPLKEKDKLEGYIFRNTKKNKSFVSKKNDPDTKFASLAYEIIANSERYYLLEIDLHTGRHHQIRCQLASIGCPIRGDIKYGFPRSNKNAGINLHAYKLSFEHPVKKEPITLIADFPDEKIWKVFSL